MEHKSAVSALQEYCAQVKTGNPVYDYIEAADGGYICKVVLLDTEAYGNGRSKRDAKHLAAAKIIRKLRVTSADLETLGALPPTLDKLTNMNQDMLKELRDFCVRYNIPLPRVEIIQQSGAPNAPEFVASCTIASIKRYGKSDKKKDARQRAAIEMLRVISKEAKIDPENNTLVCKYFKSGDNPIDINSDEFEASRRCKFKTYRELTDACAEYNHAVNIADRHNYFKSYFPELKVKALKALYSDDYDTAKERVDAVLSALKLVPRISTMKSQTMEPVLMIDIKCEFDCVFMEFESSIYDTIVDYFRTMLI